MQKTDTLEDGRLSPKQLLAYISAELRRALPSHEIAPATDEPGQVRLIDKSSGAEEARLDLANLLAEIFSAPFDASLIDERVTAFVEMARIALVEPNVDPNSIFPALRHAEFLETYRDNAFVRPGPGDCSVILMQDLDAQVGTFPRSRGKAAGWSEETLWLQAEKNFAEVLESIQLRESAPGVFSIWLDHLEWNSNSLLLSPKTLKGIQAEIGAECVLVAAPSRESVEMIDATDTDAFRRLEQWMQDCLDMPHPQSEFVYTLCDEGRKLQPRFFSDRGVLRAMN
ncbi:hypothetical protein [Thalassococcus lentus]|uniref:DUF1444 family protein n=1 Tax=Thalassococcus lentus TaxID=1210524 RepID=A0ABT4XVJ6_9RHOB|nr:hypothetical protein [Thalassococcus lentus]MDA7425870.1 hypothetical protein [Thalassococcus lentus]